MVEARWEEAVQVSYPEERHTHEPTVVHEPESSGGLVGFAAIKYTAIVIIVLAILAFLGWYVLPAITG